MNIRAGPYQPWNIVAANAMPNPKRSGPQRAPIGFDPSQQMIYYTSGIPTPPFRVVHQSQFMAPQQFAHPGYALPMQYNKMFHDQQQIGAIMVPQQESVYPQQPQNIRRTPSVDIQQGTYVQQQKSLRNGQIQALIEPKQKIKKEGIMDAQPELSREEFSFSLQKQCFSLNPDISPGFFNIIGRGNLPAVTFCSEMDD